MHTRDAAVAQLTAQFGRAASRHHTGVGLAQRLPEAAESWRWPLQYFDKLGEPQERSECTDQRWVGSGTPHLENEVQGLRKENGGIQLTTGIQDACKVLTSGSHGHTFTCQIQSRN